MTIESLWDTPVVMFAKFVSLEVYSSADVLVCTMCFKVIRGEAEIERKTTDSHKPWP